MHTRLRLEILQARDRSDELDIHGSTKLKSILGKNTMGVDRIRLTNGRTL